MLAAGAFTACQELQSLYIFVTVQGCRLHTESTIKPGVPQRPALSNPANRRLNNRLKQIMSSVTAKGLKRTGQCLSWGI